MKALDQKVLRDVWSMKGQLFAITLVIACGVATMVMSFNTLSSLEASQSDYYRNYRFADVFASLKRAPQTVRSQLAGLEGVDRVATRVVVTANLLVEGMEETAVGRFVSVANQTDQAINAIHIRRGRMMELDRPREVVVNESFALAHGLDPGDQIEAILNGSREALKIVGIGISPEYVYVLQGGTIFPDDRHFGVFWMGYEALATAFDMAGGFNDVAVVTTSDTSEKALIDQIDRLLEPYGGQGAFGREEQLSHRFVSDEIQGLRGNGFVVPSIFLAVSGFLLNLVLTRTINQQRDQIASLKAFGYRDFTIGCHYLKMVAIVSLLGAGLGIGLGMRLGQGMTSLYAEYYHFPDFQFVASGSVIVGALLVSLIAGALSVAYSVRRAVRLPPAEAMRPEPPAHYRPSLLERCGIGSALPQTGRIVLRHLTRSPVKVALSCCGIAVATSILILGESMYDAMDFMLEHQFFLSQKQDVLLSYVEPRSQSAQYEVAKLPGVLSVEPFRSIPARLVHENFSKRIGIMGLPPNGELFRLLDTDHRRVDIPRQGLLLSRKLAEKLAVVVGDSLRVEVLEGKRPVLELPVSGTTDGYTGIGAYMSLPALNRALRQGPLHSGAYLKTDGGSDAELYRQLKETPAIAGVAVKRTVIESFVKTLQESMHVMTAFNVMFAIVIAFGVVYNLARVSLAEHYRELATLRVIGFTVREIASILLGELAVITVVAIPAGWGLGFGLAWLLSVSFDTELYRLPFVVEKSTILFATGVILSAVILSGAIVQRRLNQLDLVGVLKSKD